MHTPDTSPDTLAHVAEAIDLIGGDSAVARLLNLTPWAVSKWRKNLPLNRVLWLAEQTGWRKTPHQLCPAMYPNPFDGLPPSMHAGRSHPREGAAA
ncbi:Cro/CI family transcriptional regulator [Ralstonia nicotianae]